MKKFFIVLMAALIVLILLWIFGRSPDFSPEELAGFAGESDEIMRFAESEAPDFKLLQTRYEQGPRPLVRWVDDKLDIEMDYKIHESLKAGAQGNIQRINAQIVAFTVKRVLWEYFHWKSANLADPADLERLGSNIKAFFPMIDEGENWGNLGGELTREIKTNAQSLSAANVPLLVNLVRSGFLLSLFREFDFIENLREENFQESLFHSARALQYLHMLYRDLATVNRADAVFVFGEINKMPKDMDLDEMRHKLRNGFGDISQDLGRWLEKGKKDSGKENAS